jgi:hypothetical protein
VSDENAMRMREIYIMVTPCSDDRGEKKRRAAWKEMDGRAGNIFRLLDVDVAFHRPAPRAR